MAANRIIPTPAPAASARLDSEAPLSMWRAAHADAVVERLSDTAFRNALGEAVRIVRPLAVEVARTLDGAEPYKIIGAVIGREKRERLVAADNVATDLLASALMLDAVAGVTASRVAIDFLRRRRALPAIDWRLLAEPPRGSGNERARAYHAETPAPQP